MSARKDRTGETSVANNGMKMSIIAYQNSHDMNVQFGDGAIRKHIYYTAFKAGSIKHPNGINRTEETALASNGQVMTIITYRGAADIDVQFEDGYVACHKTYDSFKKGQIRNPNKPCTQSMTDSRIGETSTSTNGQEMTIIAYRKKNDIDVRFEDGYIAYNKAYHESFKKGKIGNPHFPMRDKGTYKTFQTQYAYTAPDGSVYFYCECQKCGLKKNLTARELINLNHTCENIEGSET